MVPVPKLMYSYCDMCSCGVARICRGQKSYLQDFAADGLAGCVRPQQSLQNLGEARGPSWLLQSGGAQQSGHVCACSVGSAVALADKKWLWQERNPSKGKEQATDVWAEAPSMFYLGMSGVREFERMPGTSEDFGWHSLLKATFLVTHSRAPPLAVRRCNGVFASGRLAGPWLSRKDTFLRDVRRDI